MAIQTPGKSWSDAFLVQARSDKAAYEALSKHSLPACHRLHQLQMFLEKLCKAHMWSNHRWEEGVPDFSRQHGVVAKTLPLLVKFHCWRKNKEKLRRDQLEELRSICRGIDLLAPAVDDDGRRPDNAEYPWPGVQGVKPVMLVPCEHTFAVDGRLRTPMGKLLLKSAFALSA